MTELSRRQALVAVSALAAGGCVSTAAAHAPEAPPATGAATLALPQTDADPAVAARDARYWRAVGDLYDVTDEVIHLENGNWGMMARPVLDAYVARLEMVNRRNSYYARREFGADFVRVRARIAEALGAQPSEIALTRGATEALQNLIGGYNRIGPGDVALYADLDYDSMQTAMNWLAERRGAQVERFAIPEPATREAVVDAYAQALDARPNAKLLLVTHLSHRTGLVAPVAEICALARDRGVDVIVDAAHSWGQMALDVQSLGADFVGFNLHKWIGAPIGVGAMYIRESRIADIDPYMGERERAPGDISARVHTGTADFAAFLTAPDALDLHDAIGPARAEARLRHLRDLWAEPLRDHPAIEILTPADPRMHAGITSFRLRGRTSVQDNVALARALHDRFGVFTVHRGGVAAGACVRATPALFTTDADVIALRDAVLQLASARL